MNKFSQIIDAIKAGKTVTSSGNAVIAENIDYPWQTPKLRIELKNGASYPVNARELRSALIQGE